jgi:uncharacterized integral membrane protein
VALALFPAATELPAIVTLALMVVLLCGVIVYEVVRFAETRESVRHRLAGGQAPE